MWREAIGRMDRSWDDKEPGQSRILLERKILSGPLLLPHLLFLSSFLLPCLSFSVFLGFNPFYLILLDQCLIIKFLLYLQNIFPISTLGIEYIYVLTF